MSASTSGRKPAERPARTAPEWVTFGVALGLLLLVIGAVAREWINDDGRPPLIRVERGDVVRQENDQFSVRVQVTNDGDRAAESVQVLAELSRGEEVIEEGEQTVDFLAGGESHELTFVFTEDPSAGDLTLRAASFTKP